MDDFDKELDDLDSTLRSDHAEHQLREAWRRRFEESEYWKEHVKMHQSEGTAAHLEVWEAPVQAQRVQTTEHAAPMKLIPVGGCTCQPHTALMQLQNEKITAGIPQPVSETATYGRQPEGTTTQYGANSGQVQNQYNSGQGQTKDLYR